MRRHHLIIHRPREAPLLPVGPQRPLMAARHHVERAILRRHLADHQQSGDDVVIAVWGEDEILMPFHLGGGVRQLGVNFAVMKAGAAAADQLRGDGSHPRIQRSMAIGLGDLRR